MNLKEGIKNLIDDTEKALDKLTGETPESRAALKAKVKDFFNNLVNSEEKDKNNDEKKEDEKNI